MIGLIGGLEVVADCFVVVDLGLAYCDLFRMDICVCYLKTRSFDLFYLACSWYWLNCVYGRLTCTL